MMEVNSIWTNFKGCLRDRHEEQQDLYNKKNFFDYDEFFEESCQLVTYKEDSVKFEKEATSAHIEGFSFQASLDILKSSLPNLKGVKKLSIIN